MILSTIDVQHYYDITYSVFFQEKPASGLRKVRADIFDRFFGSLPFRSGSRLFVGQARRGGRKGGMGGQFCPPSPASSVRIFSNRHRQLGNEVIGSPATRARQPFFGEISSRFEFSKARSGLF